MPKDSAVSQIETNMQRLKLGALAKDWAKIQFINKEQYIAELLELELRARNENQISKTLKGREYHVF